MPTHIASMQPRMRNSTTVARPVAPSATTPAERPPEKPVEFVLNLPQARTVAVAGTFNNWDPGRNSLKKEGRAWRTTVWLPPGRYEYRFVADGTWMTDPKAKESAENPFGSKNSALKV